MMDLRQKIRAKRASLRITQRALAVKTGLSNSTLCAFESKRAQLSLDALERVCAALGLRLTVEDVQEEAARDAV
jgi:transcriptional regulator with XRE-family HTH domain